MPMSPRLLRPRQTGFDPRSISGLALWLDAADSQTLYTTDAGPVVPVSSPTEIAGCVLWLDGADNATITASGGLVSQWTDKSASGAVLTASGSARPTLSSTGFNSRQAIVFNGTSTNMASVSPYTATNGLSGMTRIAVCQNATANALVARATTGGSDSFVNMNGSWRSAVDGTSGTNFVTSTTFSSGNNLPAGVYADVFSSGTITQYGFGANAAATVSGTIPSTTGTGTPTLHVGSNQGANFFWNGPIAEVIYFNRALTRVEVARVEAYLAAKWGISGVHAPATATNDPVGAWLDKSGNGRHATQGTGGRRASVSSSLTNNRRGVAFAATASTSQQLTTSLPVNDSELFTVFCVMREAATPTQGVNNRVFLGNVNPGDFYYALNTAGSISATTHVQLYAEGTYAWLPNPGTTPHIVAVTKTSASQMFLNYDGSFGHMTSNVNPQYATVATATNRGLARFVNSIGSSANGSQGFTGQILEILVYPIVLSTSERRRVERYLAAKWGIGLAPQVSNADAQDWINRVYVNGGTVSAATANAVNQFCLDIENAGIRDRFYRLNLFCGNSDANLAAVRMPLFRGPSLTGTQYGNATDTNVNFVQGDYAETGASGGLTGNGSTKSLDTGFPTNTLSAGNRHLAFYANTWPNLPYKEFMGSESSSGTGSQQFALGHQDFANGVAFRYGSTSSVGSLNSSVISAGAFWIGTSGASTTARLFRNGNLNVVGTTTNATPTSSAIFIFAINRASLSLPVDRFPGRSCGYSIGSHLSDAEAANYYTAMQAFQTALGRQV